MESGQVSTKPLTRDESKTLLSFIESSKIIYNKATNATTNKMKTEEWKRIADQFNAVVTSCHRTPQQLRLKWENLKKNSRKRNTLIRMNNIKTGGGGPDYIPPDEVLDKVATLLGNTVDGFTVEYGGDAELVPEPTNWASANVIIGDGDGGGIGSDFVVESQIIKLDASSISPGVQILQNDVLNEAEDPGKCSAKEPKKYLFTPRASGSKRKLFTKGDENRSARNQAIANYFIAKTKLLEENLEKVILEKKKLQLEIDNLQKDKS
ncbi:uncharacterized protein LOC123653496 [Melitaea cinxia]|uniref:uncharacterized protein LOC123653496 n=1 Tax=Melitaea cinxia TaxID=113334 RepID=UPI001E273E91|nr:uncharacterized protein LOC123653496 [Melitaea cinxia]